MAQLGIDVTNIAPSAPREAMPVNGWLKCAITESEIKPSATDPEFGRRLNLVFKVLEGEFSNSLFYGGLNIVNKSATAQEIARRDLSAIGHAVGVLNIQDSAQLHNIPMWVKTKYVEATGQYDAKNEPTGYKNQAEKVEPASRIGAPRTAPGATPAAVFTPPAAFVPPAAAGAPAAAPAWQAPATAQPWAAPAASAPAATAPAAAAQAPLQAPAALAAPASAPATIDPAVAAAALQAQQFAAFQAQQAAQAAQAAPVAAVATPAVNPATGLVTPPWAVATA